MHVTSGHRILTGGALLAVLFGTAAVSAGADDKPTQDQAASDARLAWWRDAKFGMFIHWGVYAVPAGTYEGKRIGGIGEWIMRRAKIPVAEYRAFAKQFNPTRYAPAAWAALAKEAGMRYMVITSKHHDGFALWPSAVTDWDIADATPYGEDLIGPLAAAARAQGLKFGLYYSQAQDWTHPGGAKSGYKDGEGWDDAHKGSFDAYLHRIAAPQVREILTGYRPDILWWDTPTLMTRERAELLHPLIARRPGLITNNRLGGGFSGDTDTPEQHIPATGIPGRDWETCMTMNGTWGYKSYDDNWKSTETLVRNLIDIVSKGGNYLLNVGPTAEGEIPPPSVERLKQVGQWLTVNGDAIYGTTANPFPKLPWGRCTKKLHEDGATLYLHVFDWPDDRELRVPGLRNAVMAAELPATGARLQTARRGDDLVITVPTREPDTLATVIRLEVAGGLEIVRTPILPDPDGVIALPALEADIHNPPGSRTQVENRYGKVWNIGFWVDSRAWVSWRLRVRPSGTYQVVADVAAPHDGARFTVAAGDGSLDATAPNTGDYGTFEQVVLGTLDIAAGDHDLAVRPNPRAWKPINVRSLRLKPVER